MPPCASILVPEVDSHAAPGTIHEFAACAVETVLSAKRIDLNIATLHLRTDKSLLMENAI